MWDIHLIGASMQALGEVIVAAMVIGVHHRVKNEHKIDKRVYMIMAFEQKIGLLGIAFIILGHYLEHYF